MTSDFRAFLLAPKTIVPAGGTITVANLRLALGVAGSQAGNFKTPYLYACFGDIILATGFIPHALTVTGGQASFSGFTLRAGCILPITKDFPIDLSASANPAMVLFFAT